MNVITDTSVALAVLTSEPERPGVLAATKGADLLAPASVHWEGGNGLSAMLTRGRLTSAQAGVALKSSEQIPIRFVDVDLGEAIDLAAEHNLYAYDAYLIVCARQQRCKLISLDRALLRVRQRLASLLDRARKEGAVRIRRRDGQKFILQPERGSRSPLEVPGVGLSIKREEIVEIVRSSRHATENR